MGLLDALFGTGKHKRVLSGDHNEDNNNEDGVQSTTTIDPLNALLGTGRHSKTEEQIEKREVGEVRNMLSSLRIKKISGWRGYKYNSRKQRIEVGEQFTMQELPNIIFQLSHQSIFKRAIGGRFDIHDRNEMVYFLRKRRVQVSRMNRELNHGRNNEVWLKDLFN